MMSYVKIWVHLVWATKYRYPHLQNDLRRKLINHIRQNARKMGFYIDSINGYDDHLHALISLNPDQSIAQIAHLIKGESAHWVNKNKLTQVKFRWQTKYYAVSVNPTGLKRVRAYIRNQENHHRQISSKAEFESLIRESGINISNQPAD
jgi:REP element-mobilizing transposase RayT